MDTVTGILSYIWEMIKSIYRGAADWISGFFGGEETTTTTTTTEAPVNALTCDELNQAQGNIDAIASDTALVGDSFVEFNAIREKADSLNAFIDNADPSQLTAEILNEQEVLNDIVRQIDNIEAEIQSGLIELEQDAVDMMTVVCSESGVVVEPFVGKVKDWWRRRQAIRVELMDADTAYTGAKPINTLNSANFITVSKNRMRNPALIAGIAEGFEQDLLLGELGSEKFRDAYACAVRDCEDGEGVGPCYTCEPKIAMQNRRMPKKFKCRKVEADQCAEGESEPCFKCSPPISVYDMLDKRNEVREEMKNARNDFKAKRKMLNEQMRTLRTGGTGAVDRDAIRALKNDLIRARKDMNERRALAKADAIRGLGKQVRMSREQRELLVEEAKQDAKDAETEIVDIESMDIPNVDAEIAEVETAMKEEANVDVKEKLGLHKRALINKKATLERRKRRLEKEKDNANKKVRIEGEKKTGRAKAGTKVSSEKAKAALGRIEARKAEVEQARQSALALIADANARIKGMGQLAGFEDLINRTQAETGLLDLEQGTQFGEIFGVNPNNVQWDDNPVVNTTVEPFQYDPSWEYGDQRGPYGRYVPGGYGTVFWNQPEHFRSLQKPVMVRRPRRHQRCVNSLNSFTCGWGNPYYDGFGGMAGPMWRN